jgi:small-conductance mechanosensitive channel
MKAVIKSIFGVVFMMAMFLLSSHVSAQETSQGDPASAGKEEKAEETPELADIVPLAAELTVRLAALESKLKELPDVATLEKNYDGIQRDLAKSIVQFEQLKESKDYQYNELVELKQRIRQEKELLDEVSKPIREAVRQLGAWREEWLADKKRWREWQNSLVEEKRLDQLKSTFENASTTVDSALNLVLPQLDAMLKAQDKVGRMNSKLKVVEAELDGLIEEERRGAVLTDSAPMFSLKFFSQFRTGELWAPVQKGLSAISWPGSRFFARQGWIVLLQGLISLFVIIAAYRNRALLKQSKRWRFLTARPFSAGLFLGFVTTVLIYEYQGAPSIWKLINGIVGGISFARLAGGLIEESWKRQFVYGLVFVLIVSRLIEIFSFPLPIFRLYTFVTALAGIFFCWRFARASVRQKNSVFYHWGLRLGSLFFAVIVIAELWGKQPLPSYLLVSSIRSMAAVLVFILFMHMIHGGLEWLFRTLTPRQRASLHKDTDILVGRVARFIDIAIWALVLLPAVLLIWGVYNSMEAATKGLLTLGFNLAGQRISLGLLIIAAGFVYGSFLLSWILQNLLMDEVLLRRGVERGVRVSIKRLVHYILIFVGFLLAISALGFEITKLTIILSALGVGIGFGLQGVVNNFVSGLILLFERPVRVGDYIEMGGNWSEIKRIGLRATTVQTFDQADVIIPNADLVTNQVTNWTLSNRRARLIIPVGVAYGSDVPLVIEALMACADAHEMVVKTPAPQVLFQRFGESSLDFQLRVWVKDVDYRLTTGSELHQEIDRRFRDAGIEIAFPQRDLHLRSVDEAVTLQPPETA